MRLVTVNAVALPVSLLVLWAVRRSKRLSDFQKALSDERQGARSTWRALGRVFSCRR